MVERRPDTGREGREKAVGDTPGSPVGVKSSDTEGFDTAFERIGGGIGRVDDSLRSISRELIRADLRGPGVWSDDSRTTDEELDAVVV